MNLESVAKIGVTMSVEYEKIKTTTKLQEFVGDNGFEVFQITNDGVPIITTSDELLEFTFTYNCATYRFEAKLEKTYIKDNLILAQYKIDGKIAKVQRRESFRLDIRLGAVVRLITAEDEETVRTIDICEGGMQFEALKKYYPKQTLKCLIFLYTDKELHINAEVVRTVKCKDDDNITNVSVRFINVSKEQQSVLRKFVLKQQLLLRKRLR